MTRIVASVEHNDVAAGQRRRLDENVSKVLRDLGFEDSTLARSPLCLNVCAQTRA